jgi:hypothetical protein
MTNAWEDAGEAAALREVLSGGLGWPRGKESFAAIGIREKQRPRHHVRVVDRWRSPSTLVEEVPIPHRGGGALP